MADGMSPNGPALLALLGPLALLLFSASLLVVWGVGPRQRHVLMAALALAAYCAGAVVQIAWIPAASGPNAVLSAVFYTSGVLLACESLLNRSGARMRPLAHAAIFASILIPLAYFAIVDSNLFARIYIMNFGYGLLFLWTAFRIRTLARGSRTDKLLFWIFLGFALHFFVRTILTVGTLLDPSLASFSQTQFWLLLHLSLTVFITALALTILFAAIAEAVQHRQRAQAAALRLREQAMQLFTHDLRSPQAAILAVLEQAPPGSIDRELGDRLASYAERTLTLADNYVWLAKAEAEMPLGAINAADALIVASDEVWPLATQRGVRIELAGVEEEFLVAGDAALLAKAFSNLLHNAIKFSAEGQSVLASIARDGTARPPGVMVTIEDHGSGIPPEQQEHLFRPFWQSDRKAADDRGVGLGLALVAAVAKRHRGRVDCHSAAGRGTTFAIRLPALSPSP